MEKGKKEIRVALLGLGFMGGTHLAVYRQLKRKARVTVLCDLEPSRLAKHDPQGESRHTPSMAQAIADREVDLVDICLPTYLHDRAALLALKAGKQVLCEKPLALDSSRAETVAKAVRTSGSKFMTAQVLRFWPEYEVLRAFTRSKKLGRLRHLRLERFGGKPAWNWKNWIVDPKLSGGCLLDLHIHDVDFALHLCGKPLALSAQGVKGPEGGYDHVDAQWSYAGGLRVDLSGGWGYPGSFPFRMGFTAKFERGTLDWDTARAPKLTAYPMKGKPFQPAVPKVGAGENRGGGGNISNLGGYFVEIDYFLDCLRAGKRPLTVTPEEAALVVKAVEAEGKAIQSGRSVGL
jgi:predicted dehydrogenase